VDVEVALAEEQRDAQLELIALAIANAAKGLRLEDRGVDAAAPFVARRCIRRERRADREAPLGHAPNRVPTAARARQSMR